MKDCELIKAVPSSRQLAYQQNEFIAFIHFTVNTFTDMEWGEGTESEEIFNPVQFSAKQWVDAIKSAGMKGVIITAKHHDGFCLWHTRQTKHSVEYSPFKRDIVKELSEECKKQGINFGVYLSPWDRNCSVYGQGEAYDDFFVAQLTELLTKYGDIYEVWFDGACGEGPNGKKQVYDWVRYYQTIRELQPEACIAICGPDVRWCGNEAGHTRDSEWSVVPKRLRQAETIAEKSQKEDNPQFRKKKLDSMERDLGSRELMADETEACWFPAEVNTSIRPGWFYHASEDDKVRSFDELIDIYYKSVGGNGVFLLNLPPDRRGLIHENDCARLKQIGNYIRKCFAVNLAENADFTAESDGINIAENVRFDNYDSFWKPEDGKTAVEFTVKLKKEENIKHIVLKENIKMSQRIEKFSVYTTSDGEKRLLAAGTVVGYKKIIKLDGVVCDNITVSIEDSRVCPTFSFVGIY